MTSVNRVIRTYPEIDPKDWHPEDGDPVRQVMVFDVPQESFTKKTKNNWAGLDPQSDHRKVLEMFASSLYRGNISGSMDSDNIDSATENLTKNSLLTSENNDRFRLFIEVLVRDEKVATQELDNDDKNIYGYRFWFLSYDATLDIKRSLENAFQNKNKKPNFQENQNQQAGNNTETNDNNNSRSKKQNLNDFGYNENTIFSKKSADQLYYDIYYATVGKQMCDEFDFDDVFSPGRTFNGVAKKYNNVCLLQKNPNTYFNDLSGTLGSNNMVSEIPEQLRHLFFRVDNQYVPDILNSPTPSPYIYRLANNEIKKELLQKKKTDLENKREDVSERIAQKMLEFRDNQNDKVLKKNIVYLRRQVDRITQKIGLINTTIDSICQEQKTDLKLAIGGKENIITKQITKEEIMEQICNFDPVLDVRRVNILLWREFDKVYGEYEKCDIESIKYKTYCKKRRATSEKALANLLIALKKKDSIKRITYNAIKTLEETKFPLNEHNHYYKNLDESGASLAHMAMLIYHACGIDFNILPAIKTALAATDSTRFTLGASLNIIFRAEHEAGKSYMVEQLAKIFLDNLFKTVSMETKQAKNVEGRTEGCMFYDEAKNELLGLSANSKEIVGSDLCDEFKALLTNKLLHIIQFVFAKGDGTSDVRTFCETVGLKLQNYLIATNKPNAHLHKELMSRLFPVSLVSPNSKYSSTNLLDRSFRDVIPMDKDLEQAVKEAKIWHSVEVLTEEMITAAVFPKDVDLMVHHTLTYNVMNELKKKEKGSNLKVLTQRETKFLEFFARKLTIRSAAWKCLKSQIDQPVNDQTQMGIEHKIFSSRMRDINNNNNDLDMEIETNNNSQTNNLEEDEYDDDDNDDDMEIEEEKFKSFSRGNSRFNFFSLLEMEKYLVTNTQDSVIALTLMDDVVTVPVIKRIIEYLKKIVGWPYKSLDEKYNKFRKYQNKDDEEEIDYTKLVCFNYVNEKALVEMLQKNVEGNPSKHDIIYALDILKNRYSNHKAVSEFSIENIEYLKENEESIKFKNPKESTKNNAPSESPIGKDCANPKCKDPKILSTVNAFTCYACGKAVHNKCGKECHKCGMPVHIACMESCKKPGCNFVGHGYCLATHTDICIKKDKSIQPSPLIQCVPNSNRHGFSLVLNVGALEMNDSTNYLDVVKSVLEYEHVEEEMEYITSINERKSFYKKKLTEKQLQELKKKKEEREQKRRLEQEKIRKLEEEKRRLEEEKRKLEEEEKRKEKQKEARINENMLDQDDNNKDDNNEESNNEESNNEESNNNNSSSDDNNNKNKKNNKNKNNQKDKPIDLTPVITILDEDEDEYDDCNRTEEVLLPRVFKTIKVKRSDKKMAIPNFFTKSETMMCQLGLDIKEFEKIKEGKQEVVNTEKNILKELEEFDLAENMRAMNLESDSQDQMETDKTKETKPKSKSHIMYFDTNYESLFIKRHLKRVGSDNIPMDLSKIHSTHNRSMLTEIRKENGTYKDMVNYPEDLLEEIQKEIYQRDSEIDDTDETTYATNNEMFENIKDISKKSFDSNMKNQCLKDILKKKKERNYQQTKKFKSEKSSDDVHNNYSRKLNYNDFINFGQ